MNRDQKIYEKINQAVRLLCDVYEILNTPDEKPKEENKVLTIRAFIQKYPEFTTGKIRHYIHQNVNNFNEKVTVRVGKTIYLKEQDFFKWVVGEI